MSTTTYWRAGYSVPGAHPITVTEHGRNRDQAVGAALVAARAAAKHAEALGIELEIKGWVERWTSRTVVETDDREVFEAAHVKRPHDQGHAQMRYDNAQPDTSEKTPAPVKR